MTFGSSQMQSHADCLRRDAKKRTYDPLVPISIIYRQMSSRSHDIFSQCKYKQKTAKSDVDFSWPKNDMSFFSKNCCIFSEKYMKHVWPRHENRSKTHKAPEETLHAEAVVMARDQFHGSWLCVYFADPDGCEGGVCVTFPKMKMEKWKNEASKFWSRPTLGRPAAGLGSGCAPMCRYRILGGVDQRVNTKIWKIESSKIENLNLKFQAGRPSAGLRPASARFSSRGLGWWWGWW